MILLNSLCQTVDMVSCQLYGEIIFCLLNYLLFLFCFFSLHTYLHIGYKTMALSRGVAVVCDVAVSELVELLNGIAIVRD